MDASKNSTGTVAAKADELHVIGVIEEIERDLRERGDLFELQRRCEALAHMLINDERGRRIVEWVATEAELIDCMLIPGTAESLGKVLHELTIRLEPRTQPRRD
jgi:hypothetical protein